MKRPIDPEIAAGDRAAHRLARLAIFDPDLYLATNPDLPRAGLSPSVHAARHGLREGRPVLSALAMARAYGARAKQDEAVAHGPPPFAPSRSRATVFVHSLSDGAYRELGVSLAADLEAVGFEAGCSDEYADHRGDHGIALFVAPHEFFELGRGPLWRDPEILGAGFAVIDDAIGSPVLQGSLAAVLESRGVIDTSTIGAALWAEAGIPTFRLGVHAPLRERWLAPSDRDHPLMLAVPPEAVADGDPLRTDGRPIDLLFFDPHSPRRSAALGRLSGALARHRCFVYLQQPVNGKAAERLHRAAHWRISGHLSAHSRLTLNLTDDALPCLDRRRVVAQAMAGGSLVVSDARFAEPGLEAGVHYLADDTRHLGALIDWLILDPEGRATADRTRERAFDRLAIHNAAARRLGGLRDFLLSAPRVGA